MRGYLRSRRQRVILKMFFLVLVPGGVSFYGAVTLGAEEKGKGRATGEVRLPNGAVPKGVMVYLNPETAQKTMPTSVPQRFQRAKRPRSP